MFLESRRNFRVVKIKGIPLATAEVSFCLDINGMRRHLFLLLVDVFQKITRVEGDLKQGESIALTILKTPAASRPNPQ